MVDGEASGPAERRRGQKIRWTAEMRDRFFAHLAASCNVAASAAVIDVPPSQVHYRRRTNAAFAAQWNVAIDAAYQLLETRLLAHALAGGGAELAADPAAAAEPLDWDHAIKLFTLHKARREGRAGKRGPVQQVATRDEADRAILAKLAALAARKAGGTA